MEKNVQQMLIRELSDAVQPLVPASKLPETKVSLELKALSELLERSNNNPNEFAIASQLHACFDVIISSQSKTPSTLLIECKKNIDLFYYRALHHKEYTDGINSVCANLDEGEKEEHDHAAAAQKILFFVLEYTLEVGRLLPTLNGDQKTELLNKGMRTESGNLPALRPLLPSFRDEVSYSFCDEDDRMQCLAVLDDFVQYLDQPADTVLPSLNQRLAVLNRSLASIAQKNNVDSFSGLIYKPFPDGTPMDDIIEELTNHA